MLRATPPCVLAVGAAKGMAAYQPVGPRVATIGVGWCLEAVRRSDGRLLYRRTWRELSVDPVPAPVLKDAQSGQIETCRRPCSWPGIPAGVMPLLVASLHNVRANAAPRTVKPIDLGRCVAQNRMLFAHQTGKEPT